MTKKIIVAITGATGMLYVKTFLEQCTAHQDIVVHGICSDSGKNVLDMEYGIGPDDFPAVERWFDSADFTAPPASGSSDYLGMVVLPCSMGSLAAIANGLSINLIHRSADVILKERKTVVLGVRETPFNRTHLENMLKVHDAGAVICPPMPSFYFRPKSLEEAALTYTWRVMDQLGLEAKKRKRWGKP